MKSWVRYTDHEGWMLSWQDEPGGKINHRKMTLFEIITWRLIAKKPNP